MTGAPAGTSPVVAGVVLLLVLLLGVAAGRAKRRWSLLLGGLVATVGSGIVLVRLTQGTADPATQVTALYAVALPLAVVFVAGWLCGRTSWFVRLLVVALAALLLAGFPYAAAGRATAGSVLGAGMSGPAAPH